MEGNQKKSFLLYLEYREYFEELSASELQQLIFIIFDYEENQKEPKKPNLTKELWLVWLVIKNQLDRDKDRYDKRCETSKINGKKGGRPKNEKKPKKPKKADNEEEKDNEDVNDDDIYFFIEKELSRTLNSLECEKLNNWLENFNEKIIKYAVDIAKSKNALNFGYIEGILNNWKSQNIETMEDLINMESNKKIDSLNGELPSEVSEILNYDWLNNKKESD